MNTGNQNAPKVDLNQGSKQVEPSFEVSLNKTLGQLVVRVIRVTKGRTSALDPLKQAILDAHNREVDEAKDKSYEEGILEQTKWIEGHSGWA